jgi:predicted nucleic acid-binding protein
MVYIDSGVLVKLYVKEEFSEVAVRLISAIPQIPFSPLHEIEIRNALRTQKGRGLITQSELSKSLEALNQDIDENRLLRFMPDWPGVYKTAEELSQKFTTKLLCRALDVLHVALAVQMGCTRFITGDSRQAALAKRANLIVDNICLIST